jgi:carboxyl-terminal processing protease
VSVSIARIGEGPFDVTLTRAVIHVVSVKSQLQAGRVGYVRITTFAERTQQELVAAVDKLQQQAAGRLEGFVLDLRNDPGGLLDTAVRVAGDFLDGGTVVATRGRDADDDRVYRAPSGGDRVKGVPMVVLINGASASASEIVAGALQDHHRATLIGTRSFGKGSVQTIIPLGGHGALRLTTARYYTPSGRSIQGEGISPDIVALPPKDQRLARAQILHEADLNGALRNTGALGEEGRLATSPNVAAELGDAAEKAEASIDPILIGTAKDYQLLIALKHLHEEASRRTAARRP